MAKTIKILDNNFVVIGKNTDRARGIISSYNYSSDTELYHAYDNFSDAKENAFNYCRKLEKDLNGHAGKIVSHNLFQFTYGFFTEYEDKEYFIYITKSADYAIEL